MNSKSGKANVVVDRLVFYCGRTWHSPDGEAWVTVQGRHMPIDSKEHRQWLSHIYYPLYRGVPRDHDMNAALMIMAGKAINEGPEHRVHLRVAESESGLWLDLANDNGKTVHITPSGWSVTHANRTPVKFYRPPEMRPLPEPTSNGPQIGGELQSLINVKRDEDYRLLLTWITAAMRPSGPYPVLVVNGEHGSAKSCLVRIVRGVIDPNAAPLRGQPRDERDLVAAAKNNHVIAFDNLSSLRSDMADAMCRLATGGGLGGRRLYTDADEAVFEAQRPIVLNGITDLATRGDLASRAIVLTLPRISPTERRNEKYLWEEFEAARTNVLAFLLNAIVHGLRRMEEVERRVLAESVPLPRMADFALWGMAVAEALGWSAESFQAAYKKNSATVVSNVLADNPLVDALIAVLDRRGKWSGTATQLLHSMGKASPAAASAHGFPKRPQKLGTELRRLAPALESIGIEADLDYREGGTGQRRYHFRRREYAAAAE